MNGNRLPPLTLSADEADRLLNLAAAAAKLHPDVAAFLEQEVSRAAVVENDHQVPPDVVRIGSRVVFRDADGITAEVTLVLPSDANVNEGKVSILTPVGAALVGMKVGQTIGFAAKRGGRRLTVVSVHGGRDQLAAPSLKPN